MIFNTFAEEVRKEIRERMNEVADALANGQATSYEHYKDLCGEVRGLALAERYLIDTAERLERTSND